MEIKTEELMEAWNMAASKVIYGNQDRRVDGSMEYGYCCHNIV